MTRLDSAQTPPYLEHNRSRISSSLQALSAQPSAPPHSQLPELKADWELVEPASPAADKVQVRVTTHDAPLTLAHLRPLGFEMSTMAAELHFIEGLLPIGAIAQLETLSIPGLLGIVEAARAERWVGRVTSQADTIQESDRVRQALPQGFDGTGVTVGVLSDSYDVSGNGSAAADIDSQDLPENVRVLQEGPEGSIDEGRAMLQLVHDLAPGADLAFSSVFFGEADFAEQIRRLAAPDGGNADVLVDDIIYVDEPLFQDGIIAQAIDEVVREQGVVYFSAAGNATNQAYESSLFAPSPDSEGFFSNLFHDFDPGPGVDTRQRLTLDPGQSFSPTLQWDDPFYTVDGVDTDLDLFLLEAGTNQVITGSVNNNLANQIPNERFGITNTSDSPIEVDLAIVLSAGPPPGRLKYVNYGANRSGPVSLEYGPNSGTITPHGAAVGARAVAAVNYFNQDEAARFTSLGPSSILFAPNGDRLPRPQIRQTPDLAAIQATDTTFFGNDIDGNGFPNFSGTSAAAPHAAAIAALVLEANPHFSPEQVYQRLEETAIDIGPTGFDLQTGVGLINAYDAILGPVISASLPFFEDFDEGDLPRVFDTRTAGSGQIRVTQAEDPLGEGFVLLESSVDGVIAANELILHLDLASVAIAPQETIRLSFSQREFGDEDSPLPLTFDDSVAGDGVSLSLDGKRWFRLFDLTGPNSIDAFQDFSVNLSHFATDRHLTLGDEIQIKFQQTDEASAPLDGFAFDNIKVAVATASKLISGDQNSNEIIGSAQADRLLGFGGQDKLQGLAEDDWLNGGGGDDQLWGNAGNDRLLGGAGQDQLWGGTGDDRLDGGAGDNILSGGAGRDVFVISTVGKSTITDFVIGQDLIELPKELSFDQLLIREQGGMIQISTQISTASNRPLALLQGVEAEQITAASFIEL